LKKTRSYVDRAYSMLFLKFPARMPVYSLRPTDGPQKQRWPATAGVAGRDDIEGEGRRSMPSELWSAALASLRSAVNRLMGTAP